MVQKGVMRPLTELPAASVRVGCVAQMRSFKRELPNDELLK